MFGPSQSPEHVATRRINLIPTRQRLSPTRCRGGTDTTGLEPSFSPVERKAIEKVAYEPLDEPLLLSSISGPSRLAAPGVFGWADKHGFPQGFDPPPFARGRQ